MLEKDVKRKKKRMNERTIFLTFKAKMKKKDDKILQSKYKIVSSFSRT